MEKSLRYFQPDISDIHVGYECEWLDSRGDWKPFKVLNPQDILDAFDDQLKTPYLTKEQIEAEGWEIIHQEYKEPPYKVNWINAKKGEYTLWINLALTDSMFMGIDKVGSTASILFRGKCKDINTFRYLCKLLNIS